MKIKWDPMNNLTMFFFGMFLYHSLQQIPLNKGVLMFDYVFFICQLMIYNESFFEVEDKLFITMW
jgi:hypothetical protein